MKAPPDKLLQLVTRRGILRPRDLGVHGIPRSHLYRLERKGALERSGRGLYRLPGAEITEHHGLAEASKRVPHGVVCLLSALRFHGLTTQAPFEVWIAIHGKARRPRLDHPPVRVVHMTGQALEIGVEAHRLEGVEVRIFSAAKTVVDCFRYRNKIGLEVALEALRDYRRGRRNADELWRMAKVGRVTTVMRPYLEVIG